MDRLSCHANDILIENNSTGIIKSSTVLLLTANYMPSWNLIENTYLLETNLCI